MNEGLNEDAIMSIEAGGHDGLLDLQSSSARSFDVFYQFVLRIFVQQDPSERELHRGAVGIETHPVEDGLRLDAAAALQFSDAVILEVLTKIALGASQELSGLHLS